MNEPGELISGALRGITAVAAATVTVLLVACGTGAAPHPSAVAPAPRHSAAPLSARVVLPSRTMTAGSSMTAHIFIDNNTGQAIRASGCGTLFQVVLVSKSYHPAVTWAACLQSFTIPKGKSSYRAALQASYDQCHQAGHRGQGKACLPGGVPPLPAGDYQATLFQTGHIVPVPPATTVRVTSQPGVKT